MKRETIKGRIKKIDGKTLREHSVDTGETILGWTERIQGET